MLAVAVTVFDVPEAKVPPPLVVPPLLGDELVVIVDSAWSERLGIPFPFESFGSVISKTQFT